ncbi:acyltransferase [Flavobacterium sp. SM15]|uniref:acyltransferase family protein n=1 Tax=Flavobacterium sp. SM15 TaxID=2908005 RepID=UPI001EDB0F76|nr:acyltransferase [Flavobacterium sp. SM15]MCG2610371.1 acyltransferase [Flavobacterium sp. SM15]
MRLEQLTFTRFLAAMAIVIYHYGVNVFPFEHKFLNSIFKQANVGVSYFFILSGFVMIIAYQNKGSINFWNFIKKRIARIYPAYGFAILMLIAYFAYTLEPLPIGQLLLNSTLLQAWLPGHVFAFNYPSWSLTVEMFFYVTFPFLFNWFYNRYPLKKILIPIGIVFILSQIVFHLLINSQFYKPFPSDNYQFIYYFPLLHFNEFLVGNALGLFLINQNKQESRNYDLYILGLIGLVLIALKTNIGLVYHNGMLAVVFVPLIYFISRNNGLITKISNLKPLIFLGEISYGIYILQHPVFSWTTALMKQIHLNNPTYIFYTGVVFLIVVSAISYRFIEVPLQKMINDQNRIGYINFVKKNLSIIFNK